jgi:hypothetical protein
MHGLVDRRLHLAVVALWLAGVPLLAAGVYADRLAWIAIAGGTLLAAVVLGAALNAIALRRAWDPRRFRAPPVSPRTPARDGVE